MANEDLYKQLANLREEHGDLDASITALIEKGGVDTVRLQRLKKRKLGIKDEMANIVDRLTPDIIA